MIAYFNLKRTNQAEKNQVREMARIYVLTASSDDNNQPLDISTKNYKSDQLFETAS